MLTADGPDGQVSFVAGVLDMSEGGMRLRLPAPLPPGTVVDFQLDDGPILNGIVRYCRDTGDDEYNVGIERPGADTVLERRKDLRFDSKAPAVLTMPNVDRPQCLVTINDISRSGVGITSKDPVLPGQVVELTFGDSAVSGIVRNCRPLLDGFRIGIAVRELRTGKSIADARRMLAPPSFAARLHQRLEPAIQWIAALLPGS